MLKWKEIRNGCDFFTFFDIRFWYIPITELYVFKDIMNIIFYLNTKSFYDINFIEYMDPLKYLKINNYDILIINCVMKTKNIIIRYINNSNCWISI
jgi:hypothetical protein